jgi:hypothetical protein
MAGAAALGMGGVILYGLTRIFRPRKITMADLPELPPPPGDASGGPSMQA